MTRKAMMTAVVTLLLTGGSIQAQQPQGQQVPTVKRNYFQYTENSREVPQKAAAAVSPETTVVGQDNEKRDFISRNFRYVSMCDWVPGMRFMCLPTKEDMVFKIFGEMSTGNLISTRRLANKILVYDNHSNTTGGLHEHVNFHLEDNPAEQFFFEVPTMSFDDYCYGKTGVPTLAYLGDVDMAQDSLVGKQVRVLERYFCQDSETQGAGYKSVDIGDAKRGTVMTITKVGVGTRNYPVKIIFKEPDTKDGKGKEYFQYVTISHTNCGMRDEDFETEEVKRHTFQGSFILLDDRLAVSSELQAWVGREVYSFFDTKMIDSKGKTHTIPRLTAFTVEDIFKLGSSNNVTLTLKRKDNGESYTKELSVTNTKVNGNEEVLDELLVVGSLDSLPGVKAANMPFIQKRQVKKGFTEEEVRLALGEPSEVTRVANGTYQWVYQYVDTNRPFRAVTFNSKTQKVTRDVTR